MDDTDLCVAICVPIYESLKPDFWTSLNRLWKPSSHSEGFSGGTTRLLERRGMTIDEARRTLTAEVLASTDPVITHLLWIDADMSFPPDALQRLLRHDVPIVGGLCHNRRSPYQPILGRRHADPDRGYGWCYHYPPNALFEVDVTGAAFLLVKRQVFEDIGAKFGDGSWWKPELKSEDFSMCERARACGYTILVDTGLDIGHVGEVVIDAAFAKKNRPFEHEAWVDDPGVQDGKPVATIVIPTYNQNPRWLRAAAYSASHQTVPVEVLIVDDGSGEAVPHSGWPENVSVLYHMTNLGISEALNTGIQKMRTDWFAWLSSDDLLDPRKIEMQLAATRQAACQASFHRYQVIEGAGEEWARIAQVPAWKTLAEQREVLKHVCAINGSTVLIHRSVFETVGRFDPAFHYSQDWEMWRRIGERYFWYCLDEILGTRREVASNLTQSIAASAEGDERRARRDREDAMLKGGGR